MILNIEAYLDNINNFDVWFEEMRPHLCYKDHSLHLLGNQ